MSGTTGLSVTLPQDRVVAIPRLLRIRRGCLDNIAVLLSQADFSLSRVILVSGGSYTASVAGRIAADLASARVGTTMVSVSEGTVSEADNLRKRLESDLESTVIAVGGGRVIDAAKYASADHLPLVVVPTALSHDGICSPVASLFDTSGSKVSIGCPMPSGLLVDSSVIDTATHLTLLAGVGDLLSNLVASLDWRLSAKMTGERFDEFAASLAETGAFSLLSVNSLSEPESVDRLARGLMSSGLAMAIAGCTSPCSGGEHLISHALDKILGTEARHHGLQVALGTLMMAHLHEQYENDLRNVFRRLGVPTSPEALGISRPTLAQAICAAPSTRPERYTMLSDLHLDPSSAALLIEETFGH